MNKQNSLKSIKERRLPQEKIAVALPQLLKEKKKKKKKRKTCLRKGFESPIQLFGKNWKKKQYRLRQ